MIRRLLLILLLASPCWAAFRSIGTATSIATSVTSGTPGSPAGLAANDILVCYISIDTAGGTATFALGFTQLFTNSLATPDGQTVLVGWKRAVGGDTLTITGISSSGSKLAQCTAWSGRDTGNPPVGSTAATNTGTNASPLTVTANGVTALAGDDLVWIVGLDATVANGTLSQTPPTGYTDQAHVIDTADGFEKCLLSSKDNSSAGATGSVSGTATYSVGSAGYAAYLIRIPASATAGPNVGFKGKVGFIGKVGIK